MGYIYILTNPSFPEWVKIGYDGIKMSISSLATELAEKFGYHGPKNGAEWFTYNGKYISDIRDEIEINKKQNKQI